MSKAPPSKRRIIAKSKELVSNSLYGEQIQAMVASIISTVTKRVVTSLHEMGLIGNTIPDKQPAANASTGVEGQAKQQDSVLKNTVIQNASLSANLAMLQAAYHT